MSLFTPLEAQIECLRSLIAQPKMVSEISQVLSSNFFTDPDLHNVYLAILDEPSEKGISKAGLENYLVNNYQLIPQDKFDYLFAQDPPVQPPMEIAAVVKRHALTGLTEKLFQENLSQIQEDLPGTIEEVRKGIDKISEQIVSGKEDTFENRLESFIEKINSSKSEDKIPSFYPTLDKYTGGWGKGQLITVAARTAVGKSIVAVNCALSAIMNKKSVLFFSLEMGVEELLGRLFACHSTIPINHLYPRLKITPEDEKEWALYKKTVEFFRKHSDYIEIIDMPGASLEYIRAKSSSKAQEPQGLDFIIVDYIQLIPISSRRGNREQEVAEISRALKGLAKQLNVPVMAIAQLNRERKDDADRLPSRNDIRESAAIANDSDIILILDRKFRDTSDEPKATFILDKNRSGPEDKRIMMRCMLERSIFQDIKAYNPQSIEIKNESVAKKNTDSLFERKSNPPARTDYNKSAEFAEFTESEDQSDFDEIFGSLDD